MIDLPKNYHDLEFKDIKPKDLEAILDQAKTIYLDAKDIKPAEAIAEAVFKYIHAMGMKITRDESRPRTWSPMANSGCTHEYKPNKRWW